MSKETNSAQDFDRVFREKLEGHAVAPPAGMWENINANTQASKRKRGLLWIITSDTTIMLLLLLTSFLMLFGEGADILANISNSETDSLAETTEMANEKREAMNTVKSEMATSEPEFISSSENSTVTENKTDRIDHLETEAVESNSKATSTFVTADMNSNYKGKGDVENLSSEATNNLSSNETASSAIKKDEVPSDYNSAEKRFKRVDEPKASAIETDDREEEGLEENESLAADNVGKRGVEKQVSNQNESMSEKLRQMALIKPYLIGAFEEDSLKNFEAPKMPIQDLIGTKDHEVFVGAHVNFNLPLIFNQNTYGAFDGKELAYKPTFGLASGARIGYTFKRQYGFQTGFIFYSQQGQNYEDNLNGFAARRQVKLQYFHVPMVLRYKFKIKKQQKFESPCGSLTLVLMLAFSVRQRSLTMETSIRSEQSLTPKQTTWITSSPLTYPWF